MNKLLRSIAGLAAALLAALAGAGTAMAETPYGPRLVALSVVDRDSGAVKPVYMHDRRYFVAGEAGRRYSLRIQNTSRERLLVVLSVDGVNVVDGTTASTDGRGYILSPRESADIAGWRKSQYEIAAFEFAPLGQSYAARTGRPGNVGVIGMAVFREKRRPPPPPPPVSQGYRNDRSVVQPSAPPPPPPPPPPSPAPGGAAEAQAGNSVAKSADAMPAPVQREEKLGTGHGQIEQSYSPVAPFERASNVPVALRIVEYDSTANLIAAGVIPSNAPVARPPRAFPGERDSGGYVPDPPPLRN